MGCALVIDTNVFLLADEDINCQRVVKRACYSWDYALVLDTTREIWKEYQTHARSHNARYLREFYQRLVEREGQLSPTARASLITVPSRLDSTDMQFLRNQSCDQPIEPQLLGVSCGQDGTYLLICSPNICDREPLKRGYRAPGTLTNLEVYFQNAGKTLRIASTKDIAVLFAPGNPAPVNHSQLCAILDAQFREENQFLEFKTVEVPEKGITQFRADEAMKAVAFIANTGHPGYVFVGVTDEGEVVGVAKAFKGHRKSSWDEVWRTIFTGRKDKFEPRVPVFDQWWVPVPQKASGDERAVLVLRVHSQDGGYAYDQQTGRRAGSINVRDRE